jgi:hypothetical protein
MAITQERENKMKFNELYENIISEKNTLSEAKDFEKIYKVPLTVYNNGEKTDSIYYAAVAIGSDRFSKGKNLFVLVDSKDKKQVHGGWSLQSILYGSEFRKGPIGDKLAIDFGQDWYVSGLDKVTDKIRKDYPSEESVNEKVTSDDIEEFIAWVGGAEANMSKRDFGAVEDVFDEYGIDINDDDDINDTLSKMSEKEFTKFLSGLDY